MIKGSIQKILCGGVLLLALAACGHENPPANSSDPSSDLSPSAGNLPPPDRNNLESQNTIFFQQKEVWDSFSDDLKKKVEENYAHSGSMMGAGAGQGYYNTLFGRVSPVFGPSTPPPVTVHGADGKDHVYVVLADTAGCNAATGFLCVDQPLEGANTVIDSVLVQGSINMSEASLPPIPPPPQLQDPVILLSVFDKDQTLLSTIPIRGTDITVSPPASPGDPAIGTFSKTAPLAGPGNYAIVLTAFKETADSVDLITIGRNVVRQDVPQISLGSIMPPDSPDPGNLYPTDATKRHTAVTPGDTVSMTGARVTVKLASPGTSNVGILFQNLDESGNIRYVSNGDAAFGSETESDGSSLPTKAASMLLFPGLNHIKITAHNTVLDSLGLSPATPSTVEFNLTNVVPSVKIKLISPDDGSLIEPPGNTIPNVNINFCLTDLAGLPGRPSPAPPGQCITSWTGEKPKLSFNGYTLPDDEVSLNTSNGNYTASVKPVLGGNVISISVTNKQYFPPPPPENAGDPEKPAVSIGSLSASFGFGKVNKLYVSGALNEDNNFLKRGLSLAIGKKILTEDVKKMLTTFVNRPDFSDTLKKSFGSGSPTAPNICWEYGSPTNSSGDTTVQFLTDGFELGAIEIPEMTTRNDNLLAVTAVINGFRAKADLRSVDGPTVTYGGQDVGFIPLDINISKLTVKLGIRFVKRDGVNQLDITYTEMENGLPKVISVEGGNGLGSYVHVDSTRNPSAEGLELMDNQRGTIAQQFKDTLNRTLLCGIENGLNPPDHFDIKNPPASGMGYWIADLQKLAGYNNLNPFRIPLEFDLLNKLIGIDISYDLLRADSITFNDRGFNVRNVPLRITPSPRVLNGLTDAIKNSLIGSLSMPVQENETAPADPAITDNRNVGINLSEDAINEALFSASLAGLLDLDIDPNFYTNNEIGFIDQATPTVQDMLGDGALVDLNQNGVADDSRLPVLLRLRTDKNLPPTLHFLTKSETDALADRVNPVLNNTSSSASGGGGGTPPSGGGTSAAPGDPKSLNTQAKYFRLSLSNLDISLYRVYPLGSDVAGVKTFCSWKNDPIAQPNASDLPNVPAIVLQGTQPDPAYSKACPQTLSPYVEKTASGCPNENDYKEVVVPVKNGPIISADLNTADLPVVRFKGSLVLLGVIEGVFREVLFADKYDLDLTQSPPALVEKPGAKPTNFIRLKFFPSDLGPEALLTKLKVVENRTSFTEVQLADRIANTLIPAALGGNCQRLNEIRIPLPDRFPSDTAASSGGLIETLNNFGVDHLDLGETASEAPQAFIDENRLFVDVLAHVGVCYQGDACVQSQKKSLSAAALGKLRLSGFDWTQH